MAETKKDTGYIYKFEEISDSIADSISKVSTVVDQQKKLVAVLSKDKDTAAFFKDFIDEISKSTKQYETQLVELKQKKENIDLIVSIARSNEDVLKIVNLFYETFLVRK